MGWLHNRNCSLEVHGCPARHPNNVPEAINTIQLEHTTALPTIPAHREDIQRPYVVMGIKGLAQVIQENAPDAIKNVEIKHEFGRKIAIVSG